MNEQDFYKLLQRRLAQIAVGAPSIRNQGSGGLVKILRDYFEQKIDLERFAQSLTNESQYRQFLDEHTGDILKLFPITAQSWGAARKGINLFLREVVYSKFLSHRLNIPDHLKGFNDLVRFMEVPLDKEVAKGLIKDSNEFLPRWINIKHLTPAIHQKYQSQALVIAIKENTARVNLDLKYWRVALVE